MTSGTSQAPKRVVDLAGALFLLLVPGPVISAVLVIPVLSAGRALSPQRRVGYRGRPFWMGKSHTMVGDADRRQHDLVHEKQGLTGIGGREAY